MHFYYRHLGNGRCEVVCTRCFATVGVAEGIAVIRDIDVNRCLPSVGNVGVQAVRILEQNHRCAQAAEERLVQTSGVAGQPRNRNRSSAWLSSAALVMAAILFLYGLPTVLEFAAMRVLNPWIAVIFPGNVAGCLCLMLAFRKIGFGIGLYVVLLAGQALLYGLHVADAVTIFWISDAIPTLIVATMIMSRRAMTVPKLKLL